MQLATIWLETNSLHDLTRLPNVSPAEAIIYRNLFGMKSEDSAVPTNPIMHLEITEENSTRTSAEDFSRLAKKFGGKKVKELFPGEVPTLHQTFKEAGFEETADKEPKKGKPFVVPALPSLPDSGADLEPNTVSTLEVTVKQQQEQIAQLIALLKPKSDSTIESDKE